MRSRTSFPTTRRRRRERRARRRRAAAAAPRRAGRVVTSGYLDARRSPDVDGLAARRPARARRLGCGPARTRLAFRAMATFSVQLPGLQGLARRRARGARAAARRRARRARRRRRRRRRQHLLRHPRSGLEVAQGGRARRAHAPAASTSPAAARTSRADAFAGLPENVVVVAKRSEETPAFVAGDVGAIGCVQADARLDRVRAFVKVQDGCSFSCNFCVIPLVRGSSRSRRADAVLREIRRRVAQGHREVVLTGINLGCYRDRERRLRPAAARPRGRRDAGARAAAALVDRDQPRRTTRSIAALRETPTVSRHLHVPLQSGDDGVLRAMGRRYTDRDVSPPARAAAGRVQPDERRDRRLPDRGRARVREHAAHRARRRA